MTVALPPLFDFRDLRSDPTLKPRRAEKVLEPEPYQLEFDYAACIYVHFEAQNFFRERLRPSQLSQESYNTKMSSVRIAFQHDTFTTAKIFSIIVELT